MTGPALQPSAARRWRALAANLALLTVVTGLTLALLDVILIATGLFPPAVDEGHPQAGWLGARPTGRMERSGCADPASGRIVRFARNEDGVRTARTAAELGAAGARLRIAVGGDSHTELCVPNESTHFGFMERDLVEAGIPAAAYAFGAGKYSPLQAYVALEPTLDRYAPEVLVINFYTGNDYYDMLRVDDRPHFTKRSGAYEVAPPVWYQSDPPGTRRTSRVLNAFRLFSDLTGLRRVWVRVRYLSDAAADQGQGIGAVVGYMSDLRKASVPEAGYPQALAAQMLNQQLFFHHFPGSEEEATRRIDALLRKVRAERPGMMLVASPIPSYQLVMAEQGDSVLRSALARLPITAASGVAEEQRLYEHLRTAADSAGWLFIDNLATLRAVSPRESLFNHFDYHIEPTASALIGRNQAGAIASRLPARRGSPSPR